MLYTVSDPLGTSGGPTFTGTVIPIPAWADAGAAPQPGGPPVLQQQAGFPLHKTTIRNGLIWSCQSPSATGIPGDRSGVVVYKFDPITAALVEYHTISDPSLWYYLPAVVPDVSGNAVVTFTGSDAGHYASMYHARYDVGTGVFDSPVLTEAGASSFSSKDPQSGERGAITPTQRRMSRAETDRSGSTGSCPSRARPGRCGRRSSRRRRDPLLV